MSFEARCPQCLFVSRQLGQPTPCLLHVSLACESEAANVATAETDHQPVEDYDEPYAFGELRPTVDRPGPFSLREYVRLCPRNAWAWCFLGRAAGAIGERGAAREALQRAVALEAVGADRTDAAALLGAM